MFILLSAGKRDYQYPTSRRPLAMLKIPMARIQHPNVRW